MCACICRITERCTSRLKRRPAGSASCSHRSLHRRVAGERLAQCAVASIWAERSEGPPTSAETKKNQNRAGSKCCTSFPPSANHRRVLADDARQKNGNLGFSPIPNTSKKGCPQSPVFVHLNSILTEGLEVFVNHGKGSLHSLFFINNII